MSGQETDYLGSPSGLCLECLAEQCSHNPPACG